MEAYSAPGGPLDPTKVSADTPVMMYCTGGIRCDVYSAVLKEKGFNNLYTLSGGVQARRTDRTAVRARFEHVEKKERRSSGAR